jgi:hypothetical protein
MNSALPAGVSSHQPIELAAVSGSVGRYAFELDGRLQVGRGSGYTTVAHPANCFANSV